MAVTPEQFLLAVQNLKRTKSKLSKIKPGQISEMKSIMNDAKGAMEIIDAFTREQWERIFNEPYPKLKTR